MNTLQSQKEQFKSWFDTTIQEQFKIREELIGQSVEGIFYTPQVDGWDIDLKGNNAVHLPLGYLTFVTSAGNTYRMETNYQTWCGGIFGIMLEKIIKNETHNPIVFPLINQFLQNEKWNIIKDAKIKQVDWNWKRETDCKLNGQNLSIREAHKFLLEDSFAPESLVFHFDNNKSIFFFALEPDEEICDKQTYTLISGGEEIMIFFDETDLKRWDIHIIGFQIRPD